MEDQDNNSPATLEEAFDRAGPPPEGGFAEEAEEQAAVPEQEAGETEAEYYERLLLKVNGEEKEALYKTKEDLIKDVQKALAADQKFQEAAKLRQEYEPLIGRLRKPDTLLQALTDLGYDEETLDVLAEGRLFDKLQKQADPREYELAQLRAEKQRREAAEAQRREELERERALAEGAAKWQRDINQALEKYGMSKDQTDNVVLLLEEAMGMNVIMTAEEAVSFLAENQPQKKTAAMSPRSVGASRPTSEKSRNSKKFSSLDDLLDTAFKSFPG